MRIIAFEGLDKSGKWTQSTLLTNKLRDLGFKVMRSEFHRYDTVFGKIIKDWLGKEIELSKETLELVIAADKQNQQDWFDKLEEEYDYLILDRYIGSQIAYSSANGLELEWVLSLQRFTSKPDIEILIDIDAVESYNRKSKYGKNDRYEEDIEFLNKVRDTYLSIFNEDYSTYWCKRIKIDGTKTINDINIEIMDKINKIEKIY